MVQESLSRSQTNLVWQRHSESVKVVYWVEHQTLCNSVYIVYIGIIRRLQSYWISWNLISIKWYWNLLKSFNLLIICLQMKNVLDALTSWPSSWSTEKVGEQGEEVGGGDSETGRETVEEVWGGDSEVFVPHGVYDGIYQWIENTFIENWSQTPDFVYKEINVLVSYFVILR